MAFGENFDGSSFGSTETGLPVGVAFPLCPLLSAIAKTILPTRMIDPMSIVQNLKLFAFCNCFLVFEIVFTGFADVVLVPGGLYLCFTLSLQN